MTIEWSKITLASGIAAALMLMFPARVEAACLTQNNFHYGLEAGVATGCNYNYIHGSAYGAAASQVQRLAPPGGGLPYCFRAGTRVVGTPLQNGNLDWSFGGSAQGAWAQSTIFNSNAIGSWMYAYRGGTYFSEQHGIPGISC